MDSIISQAVREELRRSSCSRPETASSTNQDDQGRSENESGAAGSSRSSFSSRTVSCLSGLLNRMRKGSGKESSSKKRKVVKEHRIQVRWFHYDPPKKAFVPVGQKNGGGNRFITHTNDNPPSLEELMEKASALFFPGGKSVFAGHLGEMNHRWPKLITGTRTLLLHASGVVLQTVTVFTKACMGCKRFFLKERKNVMFLNKIDVPYCLVVFFVVCQRLRPF